MIRFRSILHIVVAVLFIQGRGAVAETLEYDFTTPAQAERGFDFASLQSLPAKRSRKGEGLKVSHVDQEMPLSTVGGKTRFGLRGDFEVELGFLVETLAVPASGNGSGIMLRLEFADREQSGLTVSLNASPNELLFWQIDNTKYGQEVHQVNRRPAFTNVFESPQTIRLARSGDQIAIIAGSTESSVTIASPVPTNADVSSVAMWISTGGAPADLDIELKKLRVEANEFANDIAVSSGASSWTIVFWAFAGMLGLAGAYSFRQTLRR